MLERCKNHRWRNLCGPSTYGFSHLLRVKGNNSGKGCPNGLLRSLGQWSRKRGNWNIELECKLRTVTIGGADLVLGHGLGSKPLRQDVELPSNGSSICIDRTAKAVRREPIRSRYQGLDVAALRSSGPCLLHLPQPSIATLMISASVTLS